MLQRFALFVQCSEPMGSSLAPKSCARRLIGFVGLVASHFDFRWSLGRQRPGSSR